MLEALWEPYLDEPALTRLRKYGYHSSPGTILDNFLNTRWWNPLSAYLPRSIHPNTLTVAGLVCSVAMTYLPLLYYSPHGDSLAPSWVYIVAALGFFLYQTLDALDGKQARNTGLSSPMGQLMDHGCDSLTTYFSVYVILLTIQLGLGPSSAYVNAAMTFELYYYSWYECTFGIFRSCTGKYTGVTEGQLTVMILCLSNVLFPGLWTSHLSDLIPGNLGVRLDEMVFHTPCNQLIYWPFASVMVWVNIQDIFDLMRTPIPKEKMSTIKIEWAQMGFHLWCNAALALSGCQARHPLIVTSLISFAGSLLSWRLILSSVAKSKLKLIQLPSYPFYFAALLCSCNILENLPQIEAVLLMITTAWMGVALGFFVVINMTCIRDFLKMPLFKVPKENSETITPPQEEKDEVTPSTKSIHQD